MFVYWVRYLKCLCLLLQYHKQWRMCCKHHSNWWLPNLRQWKSGLGTNNFAPCKWILENMIMDVCMERKTLLKLWIFPQTFGFQNLRKKSIYLSSLNFIYPVCNDCEQIIMVVIIFRVTESSWVETIISGKKKKIIYFL